MTPFFVYIRGLYHKTFYGCNLLISVMSTQRVLHASPFSLPFTLVSLANVTLHWKKHVWDKRSSLFCPDVSKDRYLAPVHCLRLDVAEPDAKVRAEVFSGQLEHGRLSSPVQLKQKCGARWLSGFSVSGLTLCAYADAMVCYGLGCWILISWAVK
jgi:hypothetical protein